MKIAVRSSKFWRQIADSSFLELRNQMVIFIIASKLNSAFGTIVVKPRALKWQQKWSVFSVNNLFAHVVMQWNMCTKFGIFFCF